MKRNKYSAGAVKFSFWFMEFRNTVKMLNEGKTFADIKQISEDENIFGASTTARAKTICSTVLARIKTMDESFYPLFLDSDVATQKLFCLVAVLAHDTLFFDFMYETVREKLIIGSNELADSDIRVFFKNKQDQDEKVESFTDQTLTRLGRAYKTMLFEAGILDDNKNSDVRKIQKPILDPVLKHWLEDFGMGVMVKTLEGIS